MDHVIAGKFKLGRKIGSGSFGELYLGLYSLVFYCFIFFCNFCLSSKRGGHSFVFFVVAAINLQNGEEVAVKLVCDWVFNGRIYFAFNELIYFFSLLVAATSNFTLLISTQIQMTFSSDNLSVMTTFFFQTISINFKYSIFQILNS